MKRTAQMSLPIDHPVGTCYGQGQVDTSGEGDLSQGKEKWNLGKNNAIEGKFILHMIFRIPYLTHKKFCLRANLTCLVLGLNKNGKTVSIL